MTEKRNSNGILVSSLRLWKRKRPFRFLGTRIKISQIPRRRFVLRNCERQIRTPGFPPGVTGNVKVALYSRHEIQIISSTEVKTIFKRPYCDFSEIRFRNRERKYWIQYDQWQSQTVLIGILVTTCPLMEESLPQLSMRNSWPLNKEFIFLHSAYSLHGAWSHLVHIIMSPQRGCRQYVYWFRWPDN